MRCTLLCLFLAAVFTLGGPIPVVGPLQPAHAASLGELALEAEDHGTSLRATVEKARKANDPAERALHYTEALALLGEIDQLGKRMDLRMSAAAQSELNPAQLLLVQLSEDRLGFSDLRLALLEALLEQLPSTTGDRTALRHGVFQIINVLDDIDEPQPAADAHIRIAAVRLLAGDPQTAQRSLVLAAQRVGELSTGDEQRRFASRIGASLASLAPHGSATVLAAILEIIKDPSARQDLLLAFSDGYSAGELLPLVSAIRSGPQAILAFGEAAIDEQDPVGPELAISALGPGGRDDAVLLVRKLLANGKMFGALSASNLLAPGRDRALGQALTTAAFAREGFTTITSDLLRLTIESIGEASGIDEPALAEIGRALGKVAEGQDLRLALSALPPEAERPFLAAAYRGAADLDRFELLDTIRFFNEEAVDPAVEHAANLRALVRADRLDDAIAATADLRADVARSRAVLATALLDDGRAGDAVSVLAGAADPVERLKAFDEVFDTVNGALSPESVAAARSAIEGAVQATGDKPSPTITRILSRLSVFGSGASQQSDDPAAVAGYAEGLAMRGQFEAAIRLAEQSGSSKTVADIAVLFGETGRIAEAGETIAKLNDHRIRVAAFRRLAERSAEKLDRFDLLDPAARSDDQVTPTTPGALAWEKVFENDRIVVGSAPFTGVANVQSAMALPRMDQTSRDLAATISLPEGGQAGISVTGSNRILALGQFISGSVGLGQFISPELGIAETLAQVPSMNARDYIVDQQRASNAQFIYVNSGTFTLEALRRAVALSIGEHDLITVKDGVYTIRAPLVIGPEGNVVLSGAEAATYNLTVEGAAFLLAVGRLDVIDTRLVGIEEKTGKPAIRGINDRYAFRPFITGWSESEIYIGGSEILAFGFQGGKSYGVTFSHGPAFMVKRRMLAKRPRGALVDNSFENLVYGLYTYETDDLLVVGNEYRNNIVYGIDPHDRSERLVIGYNTAYGTLEKHGIIISREVNNSFLVGNLSFRNKGTGLMLDRTSHQTIVYANTLTANDQDGIALFESECAVVAANSVHTNRRSGIRVRNSWDVLVKENQIVGNKSLAVDIYEADLSLTEAGRKRNLKYDPYLRYSTVLLQGNRLEGNGGGYSLAGHAAAGFIDNEYVNQSKRLHNGLLKGASVRMLGVEKPGSLAAATTACAPPPERLARSCVFVERGLIPANFIPSLAPSTATCEAAVRVEAQNQSN